MGRSCYNVGCKSGYNDKRYGASHVFKIPQSATEDLKRAWIQNIPRQLNRDFDFSKDAVCHLHFDENYIVKEHFVVYGATKVSQGPRKRWKLLPDAVPTKFSNSMVGERFNRVNPKRKLPKDRSSSVIVKKIKTAESLETEPGVGIEQGLENAEPEYPLLQLHLDGTSLDLPKDWYLQVKKAEDGFIATIFQLDDIKKDSCVRVNKSVQIFQNQLLTTVSAKTDAGELKRFSNHVINSVEDIKNLIRQFDMMVLCQGVTNYGNIVECKTGIKKGETWYSINCTIDTCGQVRKCSACSTLAGTLRVSLNRLRTKLSVQHRLKASPALPPQAAAYVKGLRNRLAHRTQQVRRLQRKSALLKLTLTLMKTRMRKTEESKLVESINGTDLSENMKESMRNAIINAKRKSSKGNRFEPGWLLQCLLLRIKSPKAYRHLRSNNVLPLPHPQTLQRLVAGIPCEFGFNDFVFEQLGMDLSKKSAREQEGVIMFDEIKVREEISYDKIRMQFNGFIDYGKEISASAKEPTASGSKLADHALVFMYKSHFLKTIQPLGSFATSGAASGEVLAKLLISCIVRLEAANARVSCVVSDGATTNKNMWKLLGVSGRLDKFTNKILHPCETSACGQPRQLLFCTDVPHIIKCIRNHFFKHKLLMYKNRQINSAYYQAVFDLDAKLAQGLKTVPKLSDAHLKPNSFQKMRVCLATQVFSKTMADALCFYRKRDELFLKGSEATEDFTRDINYLFDALNATHTSRGVRLNSIQYRRIDEFKNELFHTEHANNFASVVTLESLRVTLQTFIDIINHLVRKVKFDYVLTGKINQDSLERFFGILRQVAGDEDHPTILSFMHLYRLLCLYSPTSQLKKGNVSGGEDGKLAMSSYVHVLLKNRKTVVAQNHSAKQAAEDKILQSIISEHSNRSICTSHLQDHDYYKLDTNHCVVYQYQLCGYVAHRVKSSDQFTKCKDCKASVSSYEEAIAQEALLTKVKTLGALQYPTPELYNLIRHHVEPNISEGISRLHADLVSNILDSLKDISSANIGCGNDGHNENLIMRIISFYISVRMFFFVKNYNREIVKSRVKTKQQRKLSKLN